MPRPPFLAPLLIIIGAALLILTAGAEIAEATRAWLKGRADLPKELILHALIAGAALLLAAAVLMTRRSVQRTVAAEAALRESEERLRLVANNVPALISYVDRDQRYRFSNRTYDDWFGIAHEEMLGRSLAEIFGEETYARMRGEIERCLGGAAVEFELTIADGERRRTLQVACVPHLAADGEVLGFYLLANDVTALKQAQEDLRFAAIQLQHDARRLEFLAHHDTLTGLPNRAMFTDRAREAVAHARRHDKTAAFLFLDMDNFKQVNDGLGHEVGDEFCVLLQDIAEPREAAAVAQKLLLELGKPYRVGLHDLHSGASIGIACVPQDGDEVGTLMRLADHAMYRAKELGRNGYQFFSGVLNDSAAAAAELAEELRTGFERGELYLVYQPRFDIGTRQVVGAEALLRWRHPRHGVLAPEAFLPLADDIGLLGPVGAWTLREACRQGRRWLDAGVRPFSVVVNASARQLRSGNLAAQARAALEESGLPPESLLIELPEPALRQLEPIEHTLSAITACGARLGIDDFGTGYSSLPMLQRLRANAVCIDRSLIAGVPHDTEQAGLARALIALARGLNFDVVAKGVETQAQRDFLAEAGCRVCQGELFAPAGTADQLEPLLRARRAA